MTVKENEGSLRINQNFTLAAIYRLINISPSLGSLKITDDIFQDLKSSLHESGEKTLVMTFENEKSFEWIIYTRKPLWMSAANLF